MTRAISHVVNRLVIDCDGSFEDVRQTYESLVPTIDFASFFAVVAMGDLDRVQQYTADNTPNGLVNFWKLDPMPVMRLYEHVHPAVTYVVGNNVIAETMFRHDPGVMLYEPMRLAIHEDYDGGVHLSIEQPSNKFAAFEDPRISRVGFALDDKVANLLTLMSLPVPPELTEPPK